MSALSGSSELGTSGGQRRIVVGVDGSGAAARALDWAIGEAQLRDAVMDLVTAWTFPMVLGYSLSHTVSEVELATRGVVEGALAHVADVAPDVVIRGETIDDAPGPALVAASQGADLLVVGSRGLGGFETLLLGSVSAFCARLAPCNVAIIR